MAITVSSQVVCDLAFVRDFYLNFSAFVNSSDGVMNLQQWFSNYMKVGDVGCLYCFSYFKVVGPTYFCFNGFGGTWI